jgi:hypothetical protein
MTQHSWQEMIIKYIYDNVILVILRDLFAFFVGRGYVLNGRYFIGKYYHVANAPYVAFSKYYASLDRLFNC